MKVKIQLADGRAIDAEMAGNTLEEVAAGFKTGWLRCESMHGPFYLNPAQVQTVEKSPS